jgi:hypothetical protein
MSTVREGAQRPFMDSNHERVHKLDDDLANKLLRVDDSGKRYHNEIFNEIRKEEPFLKAYSTRCPYCR